MRIVHVDHSGLPGGGQLGLARYAQRTSHPDTHVHFLSGGPIADDLAQHAPQVTVSAMGGTTLNALFTRRHVLRRELEQLRPDAVVANSFRSAVALAIAKPDAPLIYYARQDMTPASLGRAQWLVAQRAVFPSFDAFIANSDWTRTTIPPSLLKGRPNAVAYPVSGVRDTKTANAVGHRKQLSLLWLGRIAQWKGLHVALGALERLSARGIEVSLTVAGAPIHENARYANAIRRAGERSSQPVTFAGHIEDIDALFRSHDVLLHTSVRPEPFGQVVLQAMAAGLATIAADAGGPHEVIRNLTTGLLVPPGDEVALADALQTLHADRVTLRQLAAEGQELACSRFSDSSMVRSYDDLLAEMIDALNTKRQSPGHHRDAR